MGISDTPMPACWHDDVRMNALFAPFRLKAANPESWDMKMKFWSDMVRQWCRSRADPVLSASDIKCAFQRNGRTAACIDIVVEEMFRNGDLSPISKYQQILHNGPEGWVRWGARLAFKPAVFALTAVSSFLPARQAVDNDGLPKASIESTQRFVLESAVREQATDLLDKYPAGVDRMGTIEELLKATGWQHSRETFEILLGYLVAQGAAVKKGDVVKLAEPNKKATPVSETDEALVKLLCAETRLERDAERLARDAAAAEAEARAALKLGNKLAAKSHLRRKHAAAQRLQRCEATLDNVRQLLLQTRDAGSSAAIVDTYRTSAQALKRTMKEGGMEEDAVHDTMDDLKEVMETYNEVERALGGKIDDTDLTELEDELRELMAGPGAPGGGTPDTVPAKGINLPSPPSELPARRKLEREFVFDGEEQMLAELNQLDSEREKGGRRVAVAEGESSRKPKPAVPKTSKDWYPSTDESWKNEPTESQSRLSDYGEVRLDERIHPGQSLNVDFTTPPRHYKTDFQVRDHSPASGVWLFNTKDGTRGDDSLATSTEYCSSESPGKTGGHFQMAPGGERRKASPWPQDDSADQLENTLADLQGLNL